MLSEWILERQDRTQTQSVQVYFDKCVFTMSESKQRTCSASWKKESKVEVCAGATTDHYSSCTIGAFGDYDKDGEEEFCSKDRSLNGEYAEHYSCVDSNDFGEAKSQQHLQLERNEPGASAYISRRSWLNNWKLVSSRFPNYKKKLQNFLHLRAQVLVDNNNHQELIIRTDSCWDFELKKENFQSTYQTILELLGMIVTEDSAVPAVTGRMIHIKINTTQCTKA